VQESRPGELAELDAGELVALLHKAFHAQADLIAKAHGVSMGGVRLVDDLHTHLGKLYRKRLAKMEADIRGRLAAEQVPGQ
jgi:hypothetical protein